MFDNKFISSFGSLLITMSIAAKSRQLCIFLQQQNHPHGWNNLHSGHHHRNKDNITFHGCRPLFAPMKAEYETFMTTCSDEHDVLLLPTPNIYVTLSSFGS